MRWLPLLLLLFACRDRAPTEAKVDVDQPQTKTVAFSKEVAKSTPPIGALVGPPTPTAARVKARSCAETKPVELATAQQLAVIGAGYGPAGGLVAWSTDTRKLALRTFDAKGQPTGETHELDVPAQLDRTYSVRVLANHYVVFLGETDYAGPAPTRKLFALVVGKDGAAIGKPLQIDIGNRAMVDDISPGAANGVLVYAGATPSTGVKDARLVTIYVAPDGAVSQSVRDYPDPVPGDRALPRFSLGEHAVIVLPDHVIVDGEMRASKSDPAIEGLYVAATHTGDKIPLLGLPKLLDDTKRRYGTLAIDGTRTFEAKVETGPLRAPFEDLASWSISSGDSGTSVTAFDKTVALTFPGIPKGLMGITTNVVWTGEQALVLFVAGKSVNIASLPCN